MQQLFPTTTTTENVALVCVTAMKIMDSFHIQIYGQQFFSANKLEFIVTKAMW